MSEERSPKSHWLSDLPSGPPMKEDLAKVVDADGGWDAAEVGYYEAVADPSFVQVEAEQRRFRAQFRRRLRHRQAKRRSSSEDRR